MTTRRPAAAVDQAPLQESVPAGEMRALRHAFLGLVTRWDLSAWDALTLMGEPVADEGERHERLQALVGLNRSLGLLFPEPEQCRDYLRRPCPALGGAMPLEFILTGGRLAVAQLRVQLAAKVAG